MSGIEVTNRTVRIFREHRHGGILRPVRVFATKIVFKRVRGRAEQTQVIPIPRAGVIAQCFEIRGSDDREIDVLCQVLRYAFRSVSS
jgi:hypothetical protein